MKSVPSLPNAYKEICSIDLQKDKKLLLLVNALSVVIGLALAIIGHFVVPVFTLFDLESGFGNYLIRFVVLILSLAFYIVLHELVHGVAMKLCGTQKVKYGFTGMYAFTKSDDYYDKGTYIFIALAPVVLWGIVLALLTGLASTEWFWVIYLVQICNLSGAAGDFYVTAKFWRFPKDILVRDYGVSMTVYAKK